MRTKKKSKKTEKAGTRKAQGFSLDGSLLSELRDVAKEEDRSISYMAGRAIREFLERRRAA